MSRGPARAGDMALLRFATALSASSDLAELEHWLVTGLGRLIHAPILACTSFSDLMKEDFMTYPRLGHSSEIECLRRVTPGEFPLGLYRWTDVPGRNPFTALCAEPDPRTVEPRVAQSMFQVMSRIQADRVSDIARLGSHLGWLAFCHQDWARAVVDSPSCRRIPTTSTATATGSGARKPPSSIRTSVARDSVRQGMGAGILR